MVPARRRSAGDASFQSSDRRSVVVSSELLVSALGKLVSAPEVVGLLRDLELGGRAPEIQDGVSSRATSRSRSTASRCSSDRV